jgi:Phosphatase
VSRKPRSERLPPKLPDPANERPARVETGPNLRELLKRSHAAGRSLRFGRDEVTGIMRRVEQGAPSSLLGLPAFTGLTREQIAAAVELVYGWEGDGPRARIAPARTVDGFTVAVTRLLEVARGGGRLAFATTRPAALLQLYRRLAARAAAEGAEVLGGDETVGFGPTGRRIRWVDHVAVLTDGAALLADDGVEAAEEWLFALAFPDLVIADHSYAGVASASGLEVVAFADLDAVALAVASWQGRAVRVVPLDDRRPPAAYAGLLDLLESLASTPVDPFRPVGVPAETAS